MIVDQDQGSNPWDTKEHPIVFLTSLLTHTGQPVMGSGVCLVPILLTAEASREKFSAERKSTPFLPQGLFHPKCFASLP